MTTPPPNYPYPGQPGGQGYGQPGYPHAPGAQGYPAQPGYPPPNGGFPPPGNYPPGNYPPGFPPGGFPPPAPPPRRSGGPGKAIAITVAIVVAIGLIYGLVVVFRPDGEKVAVGECAKLSGTTFKAEFATKECSDPEANYVVAERIDGANKDCATKDYASYYQTGSNEYTLCLRLNVKEGDCVHSNTLGASTKVPCTATADYKIGRIVRGKADTAACGADYTADSTIAYPKPDPMTLCLVPPK
ncbi:LppU/SCO3897 family protein [Nocardia sp. CA-128927]|uniref:LppU/SCO3897 family protein n=1 Tax=Nocardia sp. CA-128927 TaxID=3239975 RepID=UPI003D9836B3